MARTPDNSKAAVLPLSRNSAGQGLLLVSLALLALGVVIVNSAMARPVGRVVEWQNRTDVRHCFYALLAVMEIFFLWRFDYHRLNSKRFPYLAGIMLGISLLCAAMVFVPGIGQREAGYSRWIKIGGFVTIQPSEMIKYSLVIFLSAWLGRSGVNVRSFTKTFIPAIALIGLAVGPIVIEDFSAGALIGLAAVVTLILAEVPWYYLLTLVPPLVIGVWKLVVTDPYRWPRIVAWRNPYVDSAATFQPRESLTAIISGGWAGKGLGWGTVKNGFLPEGGTDFIFSVYCEELGYVGAILLLGLMFLWMWHARKAAVRASDKFGALLAGSLGILIAMQAVIHIAVALVVVPTTGMGLPFLSYGGTGLVCSAAAVALMISVSAHSRQDETLAPAMT